MPMHQPPTDAGEPTRVLVVRHGQSEWNALGRWQGQADPPLSDLGRRQAHEAARALGTVDAVWSSDLQRAVGTATIIADHLGVGPVVLDPDLRERDAGEFSGLTRAEIDRRYPGYLDDGRRPPGWEADGSLVERAVRALQGIAEAVPGGEVVAVAHGGLVYAVEQHLGEPFTKLANTEGRWFAVGPGDALRLGERVVLSAPEDTTVPNQI